MKHEKELEHLFECRYYLDEILQRPYEWGTERIEKLVTDLSRRDKTHNIGDILTWDDEEKKMKCIFDGQQRITTIFILLANIKNHPNADERDKEAINNLLCTFSNKNCRLEKRLNLRNEDDVVLIEILENNIKKNKSKLAKAYKFITDKFTGKMNETELGDFYRTVCQNLRYLERECDTRAEGIEQFVRLNSYCQPLKPGRMGIDSLYSIYCEDENKYRNEVKNFLLKLTYMDDKDAKESIALYLYYKTGEYKEYDFTDTIYNEKDKGVDVVKEFYDFYHGIYKDVIDNSNELFKNNIFTTTPALRCVYIDIYSGKYEAINKLSESEKEKVYKAFEWGFISNKIKKASTNPLPKLTGILSTYKEESGMTVFDFVVKCLDKNEVYAKTDELKYYSLDNNAFFVNLFRRIEYQYEQDNNLKEASKTDRPSTEHIYPTTPEEELPINPVLRETIGNKTILDAKLNAKLKNLPPSKKFKEYAGSVYHINSKHLATYTEWNDENIKSNADFYIGFIKKFYNVLEE